MASSLGAEFQAMVAQIRNNSYPNTTLNYSDTIGAEEARFISDALRTNSTITSINLAGHKIGDEGARYISDALQSNSTITSIDLRDNKIGAEGARYISDALRTNSTITSINLLRNKIGTEGARYISDALRTNSTITSINLGANKIGAEGARFISDALRTNSTITSIYLEESKIGTEGARYISDALRTNSTITSIDLMRNKIGTEGARYISDALQTNSTITSIVLADNDIGDEGARFISDALRTNSTITSIYLGGNDIGAEGAQYISDALRTNSTITSIDFHTNFIGAEGAGYISDALQTNSTITSIDLMFTNIGDEGAQYISDALRTNSTITSIDLVENNIGDEGARYISDALQTNSTITNIYLQENSIEDEGARYISNALRTNTSITVIGLQNNEFDESYDDKIEQYLNRNLKLKPSAAAVPSVPEIPIAARRAFVSTTKLNPECYYDEKKKTLCYKVGDKIYTAKEVTTDSKIYDLVFNGKALGELRDLLSTHVTRSVPANKETSAPVSTAISVTFDDSIRFLQLSPGLFQVSNVATGVQVEGRAAFHQETRTLAFTPHRPLEYHAEYIVSHDPSSALEGADRSMKLTRHDWRFTTRDSLLINVEVLEEGYPNSHRINHQLSTFEALVEHIRHILRYRPECLLVRQGDSQVPLECNQDIDQLRDGDVIVARVPQAVAELRALLEQERAQERARWMIPLDHLAIDESSHLGAGALGEVKRATWNNSIKVAAKRLFFMATDPAALRAMGGALSTSARQGVLREFTKEYSVNSSLRHPNIVMFLGVGVDRAANDEPRFLVMELMARSLHDEIYPEDTTPRQGASMTLDRVVSILLDVSRALAYLHSRRPPVLHLDLKPKNVLIDRVGTAKIGDLGEAHVIQSTQRATQAATAGVHGIGTSVYMAPEMAIEGLAKGAAADMFSLGVMACEMSSGALPNPGPAIVWVSVRELRPVPETERRAADIAAMNHPEIRELVEHLVVNEADQRWDAMRVQSFLQEIANRLSRE